MENHVALAAEKLFNIGPLPITNSILTTWLVTAILVGFAAIATRKVALVPNGVQNFAEFAVESLHDLVSSVAGTKTAIFFPIIASFFFFIIVGNYLGLLPGFGTIGIYQQSTINNQQLTFVPFFRSINSDLNTTLALALVSVIATHYLSIKYLGLRGYIGKFFSLNPIFLFVGIIELAGEFTKVVSLSFRLFGNIFAGETALETVSSLFAFIAPIPFMLLEIIVGFVQALVFAMLTLVFMVILTQKAEH